MNSKITNSNIGKGNKSLKEAIESLLGIGKPEKRKPIKFNDRRDVYSSPESFAQFFRVFRFDRKYEVFVMDDEISVGTVIEISHFAAEDKSIDDNFDDHDRILSVFENLPERETNPYVVAIYSQEEPLNELLEETKRFAEEKASITDPLGKDYCEVQNEHFKDISNADGLFNEGLTKWRAVNRKTRVVLYRRFDPAKEKNLEINAKELKTITERVTNGLNSGGLETRELNDDGLYKWLNPWFSTEETDTEKYDKVLKTPYQADETIDGVPDFEADILDWILDSSPPRSGAITPDDGTWKWGSDYVRYIPIIGSKNRPKLGQITTRATIEKKASDKSDSGKKPLFFRLPRGCIYVIIFMVTSQDQEQDKLAVISKASRAQSREGANAREYIEPALTAMVKGHKMYPTYHGFYIREKTKEKCIESSKKAIAEIQVEGFRCIELEDDLNALDEAVSSLPFAYEPEYDRYLMRQYPMWLHDIVSLIPIWGQSEVNGSPVIKYFDRYGSPIKFDPIEDKTRVAHMFMGGATGSGKSANLIYILWEMYCANRPRNFIVDYGGSYRLLSHYFETLGVAVKYSKCSPSDPAKFALYGEAKQYLSEVSGQGENEVVEDFDDEEEDQDFLTQAAFVTMIMVTGGDEKAFQALTNAQTANLKLAIIEAAKVRVKQKDHQQLLPSDVSSKLREMAKTEEIENRKTEFTNMADAIRAYTLGFYGKMFDQYVPPAEDFDVEVLDIGILGTNKQYNDAFILAWVGLLNRLEVISSKAVAKGIERDTILVNDEAHITMETPMMAEVLARKSKVFRKQAIWMILATQELDDIPKAAKKIVAMMEWLIFMSMNKDQLDKLEQFVELDDDDRKLILSSKGNSTNFKEGVLFSDRWSPQIFRNIPPPLVLALGQTEKKERKKRKELADTHGLTCETDISRHVAESIRKNREANRK